MCLIDRLLRIAGDDKYHMIAWRLSPACGVLDSIKPNISSKGF